MLLLLLYGCKSLLLERAPPPGANKDDVTVAIDDTAAEDGTEECAVLYPSAGAAGGTDAAN